MLTYDPVFKSIFSEELHPGRLDMLISDFIGQKVKVIAALPVERIIIDEESSLLKMDIIAELENGSLVDVEMQKIGLKFPVERAFCYGADLLMREYDIVKKRKHDTFSYKDIKPVYVIIFMEQSYSLFWEMQGQHIHRSRFIFDTGLEMNELIKFIFVPLDIFREKYHNKDININGELNITRLEAWMYLLSSDRPQDMEMLIK